MATDDIRDFVSAARMIMHSVDDVGIQVRSLGVKVDDLTENVNDVKIDVAVLKTEAENKPKRPCTEITTLKTTVFSHLDEHREKKKVFFGSALHIILEVIIVVMCGYLFYKFGWK